MNLNISKLITISLIALFCASCGSDGSASSGANIANILTAPAAPAPAPAPEPVVELTATVIDDFGQTCPRQNSTMCGGFGIALVPASGGGITGLACGPGTAVNQWVQNFEWVPC
ncbi:MAG TPA: hypothetical protein DCY55_08970 [Gammaproteobacteria bacterium]|nr:hypothetical protein [Gammaproteobacteria bacterium]